MNHLGPASSALVDGELGHEARDRALAHVAHCPTCRAGRRRRARRQGPARRLPPADARSAAAGRACGRSPSPVARCRPAPAMPLGPRRPDPAAARPRPVGARRDSRRPAGSAGAGARVAPATPRPAPSRWRGWCSAPPSSAGGADRSSGGPVVPPAAELSVEHAATTTGFTLGDPASGCDRLRRRHRRPRPSAATVRRLAPCAGVGGRPSAPWRCRPAGPVPAARPPARRRPGATRARPRPQRRPARHAAARAGRRAPAARVLRGRPVRRPRGAPTVPPAWSSRSTTARARHDRCAAARGHGRGGPHVPAARGASPRSLGWRRDADGCSRSHYTLSMAGTGAGRRAGPSTWSRPGGPAPPARPGRRAVLARPRDRPGAAPRGLRRAGR